MKFVSRLAAKWRAISKREAAVAAAGMYAVFFTVGSIGHYLEATRPLMIALTPWFLFIFGITAVAPIAKNRRGRVVVWGLVTYLVTFTLEAAGVATGVVFGEYSYGATLGIQVIHVPLIIGFNWVIVVLASVEVSAIVVGRRKIAPNSRFLDVIIRAVITGLIAVGFDIILEPVAIRFDYWSWSAVSVPLRNYFAWFLIAAVCSIPYSALKLRVKSRIPVVYVLIQFLFIASLLPLSL